MQIVKTTEISDELLLKLLAVWQSSVEATHLFLSAADIAVIKTYVPQALKSVEHMGFIAYKRSDYDEQGNPYPLLYIRLN